MTKKQRLLQVKQMLEEAITESESLDMVKDQVAPKQQEFKLYSPVNFKVSLADKKRLHAQAEKYTNGNLSAWLRYAGVMYSPKVPTHA